MLSLWMLIPKQVGMDGQLINKQMDGNPDGQTGKQRDGQTEMDGQIDRHTDGQMKMKMDWRESDIEACVANTDR